MDRTTNSIKNIKFSLSMRLVSFVCKFIVRSVFISYLSIEYLGVSGLFSNILTLLSLSELGIGSAITYNMYGAYAKNDTDTLSKIMNFYGKVYRIIGIFIFFIGICLTPFIKYIVADNSIKELNVIFILYIINTASSYFFSHNQSLLIVAQKEWIKNDYEIKKTIIQSIVQVLVLIVWKYFIVYLLIEILFSIVCNYLIAQYVKNGYGWLNSKKELEKDRVISIVKDIKAMFLHKIGAVAVDATDNLLISIFQGIYEVGIFSNYTMVTMAVGGIINSTSSSLVGSIGNLNASEPIEKRYAVYKKLLFANMLIVSVVCIYFFELLNPFITVWIGVGYLLPISSVILIVINFYLRYVMNITRNFKDTLGLFQIDKYKSLIEAIINLSFSIVLLKIIGFNGVLLGTTLSSLFTFFWVEPIVLYKYGFELPLLEYWKTYLKHIMFVAINCLIIYVIYSFIQNLSNNIWIRFILKGIVVTCVVVFMICIYWKNSEEFEFFFEKIKKDRG